MKTPSTLLISLWAASAMTLSSPLVHARIGETPAECISRYGEPIEKKSESELIFSKSGMVIMVTFFEGRGDVVAYCKAAQDVLGQPEPLSDKEIEVLIGSNGAAATWKKLPLISLDRQWGTEDGKLIARYATMSRMLVVGTAEFFKRSAAAKAEKESKNLDGF
jgi:hypothetical protein